MLKSFAIIIFKFRLLFFFLSVALIFAASFGFKKIEYTADYRVFFAPNDPHLSAFENLQKTYSRADNIMFVVSPKNGTIFTKEALQSIAWLTQQSWLLPNSLRVDSITNFPFSSVNNDEIVIKDLVDDADHLAPEAIERIKKNALGDVRLTNNMLSENGNVSAVNISLNLPDDQTKALHDVMSHAIDLKARFEQRYPNITIRMLGLAPFNYSLEAVANSDFKMLGPIMFILILAIIGWMTRSFANSIVTLIVITATIFVTMGLVSIYGLTLNNINTVAPLVIITLAVADSVHLLSAYSKLLRSGLDKYKAMQKSIADNIKPTFLTCFTTVAGMLGMNTVEAPPFREFGNVTAVGIFIAFLFSFTLLPQLAVWFARTAKNQENDDNSTYILLAKYVSENYRKVFYITLCITLVTSSLAFLNDLNDDHIGYFRKNVPIREASEFTNENLTGINTIEYSLNTNEDYGITDITFLNKVEAFANWYRAQPEVRHVSVFNDTLKQLNMNMHGDDPAWYKLPESREMASQYILLYELSLPVGMDLNNQLDIKKSSLRFTAMIDEMKAKGNLALEERAQHWLSANAPELQTPGTSPAIMFSHIGQRNINSVMSGTLGATLVIFILLVVSARSLPLGILGMLANILPGAVMLGLWGFFVGEVNMGAAVVFTISTGIVIDDTIHFITWYVEGRKKGLAVDEALLFTITNIGNAAFTTSLVLVSGFGIFVFSDFMVNVTLGILVAGTIAIALLFDIFFLPSIIKVMSRFSLKKVFLAVFSKEAAASVPS